MINGVIKNKVDELEAMAGQIQDESVDLIKGIPFVNFDIHTYPGSEPLAGCKWGISKGNIRELQSDVIRLYQRWYSASSHFTKNYLDEDRNKEFKDIYKQIIKFLQPTR